MSSFAEIDGNNIVLRVIEVEQYFINKGVLGEPYNWVETHKNRMDKNYAGVGFTYDTFLENFIAPQPFPSWTLISGNTGCYWKPPVAYPDDDKMYTWDETTTNWIEVTE